MRITPNLRKWLVEHCDAKADATDDELRTAVGEAITNDKLSTEKLLELNKDPKTEEANEFTKKMDTIAENFGKLVEVLTKKNDPPKEGKEPSDDSKTAPPADKDGNGKPSNMSKTVSQMGGTPAEPDGKETNVRVKEAIERYGATKSAKTYPSHCEKSGRPHPMAGRPLKNYSEQGRPMDEPSERDMAIIGAYGKLLCATVTHSNMRKLAFQSLSQHDKDLLRWAMDNEKWSGSIDGDIYDDIRDRKLTSIEKQALIDDALSGGLEAAPIVFDDQVISTPLLHGELFPLVNRVPIDRGRRIEGVSTGTVGSAWGGVDNTAIALFNTNNYVRAFDTTIFRWQGAIRIGLDFLSDTPVNFGQHITQQYGEVLLHDLDDVIANGLGGTQPLGVMGSLGTTPNWLGVTSLGNYEALRFGVVKEEHVANLKSTAVFCGTETSYMRARAIPVGAADARRLGGMDYDSYRWMERDYKVNGNLANTQVFYAILGRYRMYVRRGLTIRTSTEGETLIRANAYLMTATARYGGQMERAACSAGVTTAPA